MSYTSTQVVGYFSLSVSLVWSLEFIILLYFLWSFSILNGFVDFRMHLFVLSNRHRTAIVVLLIYHHFQWLLVTGPHTLILLLFFLKISCLTFIRMWIHSISGGINRRSTELTNSPGSAGSWNGTSPRNPIKHTVPVHRVIKWLQGELIDEGAFGKVFKAMNAETGAIMAVKQVVIPKDNSETNAKVFFSFFLFFSFSGSSFKVIFWL